MTTWKRFIGLIRLERKAIFQIIYYAIFAGIVGLSLPLGIQAIINMVQGAQVSSSWVVLVILVTIGVVFVGLLQLMQLRIIETVQQRIFVRASFELSYRFPKIKMNEFRNYYPPELANRFFDTLTIQKGLAKILIDVPTALLQIIFALILLSFYHPFFIVFGFLLLILIFLIFKFTAEKGLNTSILESKHKYKVVHWIEEIARTITSFKLAGNTRHALDKNDTLVANYLNARENHFRVLVIQFSQMIGFKVLVTAGLLFIGGALVLNQQMNIGQFVAAEIIILLVINSVEKIIVNLETLYDVLTSIEKLGELVDKKLEPQQGETPDFSNGIDLEFNQATYMVDNRHTPILNNLDFSIKHKQHTIIAGESGAGKSSLMRLISGIILPTSGQLNVNSYAMESLCINHYRGHLGLSLSEETPFEGTLRDNITFGDKDITDEHILWALNKLGLTPFFKQLPKGLNTVIYPEGKHLSETVSKKIVLARAIVKRPKLLILEDSMEKFDEQDVINLIDFLGEPEHPWTLVVVSNHEYWKRVCKQIIRLKEGAIVKNA